MKTREERTPLPSAIDAAHFRHVLGRFPTGVTVIAAMAGGTPCGFAVGSFFSVSLGPPLVGFCAGKGSTSWPGIRAAGSFCANVLAEDQEAACRSTTPAITKSASAACASWQCNARSAPCCSSAVGTARWPGSGRVPRRTPCMDIFAFGEEQHELRRTVRAFLEDKSPETEVRRLMETADGYDPAVWRQLGQQLGLQGLAIPEEFGGSGFGYVELGIVLEEMGAALLCAPYFSSVVLAANALLHAGDDAAKKQFLPGIASGETIATLALTEESGRWDESGITLEASSSGDGWRLTGSKMFVLDGCTAALIVVAARTAAGVTLFTVPGDATGLTRIPLSTMDLTRKQARLEFADTPARILGPEGAGWNTMTRVLELAAVALAAEQVGGARKVLEMAVGYAKLRVQFGRPIGSFQAIKHKCADMLVEVESARSAAYYAMWAAGEPSGDLAVAASLAKVCCSEAFCHGAAGNIQIHGGIGFSWEHPAHLYLKRAKSSELLFGDPVRHRKLLAGHIGI